MLEVEDTDKDMDKTTEAELTPGFKLTQFGVSPIMSTYLVAVVVGEFEALSGQTQRFEQPIQVRVLTLRGQKDRGEFALRTRCVNKVTCSHACVVISRFVLSFQSLRLAWRLWSFTRTSSTSSILCPSTTASLSRTSPWVGARPIECESALVVHVIFPSHSNRRDGELGPRDFQVFIHSFHLLESKLYCIHNRLS